MIVKGQEGHVLRQHSI